MKYLLLLAGFGRSAQAVTATLFHTQCHCDCQTSSMSKRTWLIAIVCTLFFPFRGYIWLLCDWNNETNLSITVTKQLCAFWVKYILTDIQVAVALLHNGENDFI